jgi:hypothetical protein
MSKPFCAVAVVAASALSSLASSPLLAATPAAPAASQPGMTYASIQHLPDFTGWWTLKSDLITGGAAPPPPPFKPQPAALMKEWSEKMRRGQDPADIDGLQRTYCGPARFSGFNGGLQDYMEFLFTPGRVTIANEMGLVRRIRLNRALPTDPVETNTGVSVARWEGTTLVVETAGVDRDIGFNEPRNKYPVKIGRNVRITERISLKEPDVLQIVTRMVAPEVLSGPYETTTLYRKDPKHEFEEITNCVQNRAFDNSTGRERFDLTPPADLPPPPSN